eukprot:2431574-Lingulodinium_polyedra.AAC.1
MTIKLRCVGSKGPARKMRRSTASRTSATAGLAAVPGADQDSSARPATKGSPEGGPRMEERHNHHRAPGGLDDL